MRVGGPHRTPYGFICAPRPHLLGTPTSNFYGRSLCMSVHNAVPTHVPSTKATNPITACGWARGGCSEESAKTSLSSGVSPSTLAAPEGKGWLQRTARLLGSACRPLRRGAAQARLPGKFSGLRAPAPPNVNATHDKPAAVTGSKLRVCLGHGALSDRQSCPSRAASVRLGVGCQLRRDDASVVSTERWEGGKGGKGGKVGKVGRWEGGKLRRWEGWKGGKGGKGGIGGKGGKGEGGKVAKVGRWDRPVARTSMRLSSGRTGTTSRSRTRTCVATVAPASVQNL